MDYIHEVKQWLQREVELDCAGECSPQNLVNCCLICRYGGKILKNEEGSYNVYIYCSDSLPSERGCVTIEECDILMDAVLNPYY